MKEDKKKEEMEYFTEVFHFTESKKYEGGAAVRDKTFSSKKERERGKGRW